MIGACREAGVLAPLGESNSIPTFTPKCAQFVFLVLQFNLALKLLLRVSHGTSSEITKNSNPRRSPCGKVDNEAGLGDRWNRGFLHVRGYCCSPFCLPQRLRPIAKPHAVLRAYKTPLQRAFSRIVLAVDRVI